MSLIRSFQEIGVALHGADFNADTLLTGIGPTFPSSDLVASRPINLDTQFVATLAAHGDELPLLAHLDRELATQTLYQYNKRLSYGPARTTGLVAGSAPASGVATYQRNQAAIRFLQTKLRPGESEAVAMRRLLGMVEDALMWGTYSRDLEGECHTGDDLRDAIDGLAMQIGGDAARHRNERHLLSPLSTLDIAGIATHLRVTGRVHNLARFALFAHPDALCLPSDLMGGMTTKFGFLRIVNAPGLIDPQTHEPAAVALPLDARDLSLVQCLPPFRWPLTDGGGILCCYCSLLVKAPQRTLLVRVPKG